MKTTTQVEVPSAPPGVGSDLLVQVEGFHKTYGSTVAVSDLSFSLRPGDILGLIGRNGAGKTTTLRVLTGILPPTRGRLLVGGQDVVKNPVAAKRLLAYVPDDPRLFDALTVGEHLQFIAAAYQVAGFEGPADALLEQFELVDKRDTLCQELSRGMRQKVAICCALLHAPRVILFDEPLTGLDPRAIRTIKETIVRRARDGATVILSSHLLMLVEDLCTHYLILETGRKRFFGNLTEARAVFDDLRSDASLEEVFFRATDQDPAARSA